MHDVFVFIAGMLAPIVGGIVLEWADKVKQRIRSAR